MTNKAQTMLTIALTAAVSVLLVDRMIEPAQANMLAPSKLQVEEMLKAEADRVIERVLSCMEDSRMNKIDGIDSYRLEMFCTKA